MAIPKWFLSFDCATKTFAFSLGRVDLEGFKTARAALRARLAATQELTRRASALIAAKRDLAGAKALVASIGVAVAALNAETAAFIQIVDGATVDLVPGSNDADIPTVERLRAMARYIETRVRPAVARHCPAGEPMRVIVEFQMGQNSKSRLIAAALVALFSTEDIIIVGPSWKNGIAVCEEGRYCYFAERYANAYGANKAHSQFNFEVLEKLFGTNIAPMRPPSLRGHVADSFMQIIGFLVLGPDKNAEKMF